ncbi:hypothetical protein [Streptomyces sp. NBC_01244]
MTLDLILIGLAITLIPFPGMALILLLSPAVAYGRGSPSSWGGSRAWCW